MSRKALLVGLEYPSEPDYYKEYSVNDVLEFNKCLTEGLNFSQSDINIIVDTSATKGPGKKHGFHANIIMNELSKLISGAKAQDILLFVLCGHGTLEGQNIYLGHDEEGNQRFMTAKDFDRVLKQVPTNVKLYMFINCDGSGGLVEGFNNQLSNDNYANSPLDPYPSVITFTSCKRGTKGGFIYSLSWGCKCSHFMYVAIRVIETNHNLTNLKLARRIGLLLEERDVLRFVLLNVAEGEYELDEKEKNDVIQHPALLCTNAQSIAQFLSN
jgi:hypothetical protein